MLVGMAGLQVFVVRFFFQGARKGESVLVLSFGSFGRNRSGGVYPIRIGC